MIFIRLHPACSCPAPGCRPSCCSTWDLQCLAATRCAGPQIVCCADHQCADYLCSLLLLKFSTMPTKMSAFSPVAPSGQVAAQVAMKMAETSVDPNTISALRFLFAAACFLPGIVRGLQMPRLREAGLELGLWLFGADVIQSIRDYYIVFTVCVELGRRMAPVLQILFMLIWSIVSTRCCRFAAHASFMTGSQQRFLPCCRGELLKSSLKSFSDQYWMA